jgi:predicted dehydrogenase
LLAREHQLDFVDIITDVDSHTPLARLAARHGVAVICQKPMAGNLREATRLVQFCNRRRVPLLVHENFRWQTPLRALRATLDRGAIGRPLRARSDFISVFPVFENQPGLADLEQFIITDLGSHTLDLARFLFGEAASIYCRTQRVHKKIKGEDVATILLEMRNGAHVIVNLAYAGNALERDAFPETLVFVEGEHGSAELVPGCELRVTTHRGTRVQIARPPKFAWADSRYAVVHSSIVPCNANLLRALQRRGHAETTGEDNVRTLRLVFNAYASAARGRPVRLD